MLLILTRGSPALGPLELSRFPWVPHPRGPHHSFRNAQPHTSCPPSTKNHQTILWSTPAGCSESQQNLEAVGKDVQSQLRHYCVPWFAIFDSSSVDIWLFFLTPPCVLVELGLWHFHWLFRGIITSVVGAFLGMCGLTTSEGCMLSWRECVAWLMFEFLVPCVSLDSHSWVWLTS
jgi:hypothetical protein